MYTTEFLNCCGAHVISDLGWDDEYAFDMSVLDRRRVGDRLEYEIRRYSRGMILIILNEHQIKKGVEEVILSYGFKKVGARCGNGNDIQLYQRVQRPSKRVYSKLTKKVINSRFK